MLQNGNLEYDKNLKLYSPKFYNILTNIDNEQLYTKNLFIYDFYIYLTWEKMSQNGN